MTNFQLGPVTIYSYGLCIALACALAFAMMAVTAKKQSIPVGTVSLAAVLMLPLGLIGARLAWCLIRIDWVLRQEHFFFQFVRGGYVLYGALIGVAAALLLTSRIKSIPFARLADLTAVPGLLVIAVGRMAEGLVGEGYGRNLYDWFDPWNEQSSFAWEDPSPLFHFPFAVPDHYDEYNFAIFVLEALAAVVILILVLRCRPRKDGAKAVLALLLYASLQTVWESMRQDSVLRFGFVRVNQLLSAVMVLALLLLCIRLCGKTTLKQKITAFSGVVVSAGIVMMMEFALEKKIGFLTWMRMGVCYVVMFIAAIGLVFSVLPMWRRAFPSTSRAE